MQIFSNFVPPFENSTTRIAIMTGKLSTGDKYCICEICINSCHAGHDTTFIDQLNFHGFCDCGDEGSRGIRSCQMLKGTA